jgi:hypothetical protein
MISRLSHFFFFFILRDVILHNITIFVIGANAYPTGAPDITPGFSGIGVTQSLFCFVDVLGILILHFIV